MTDRRSSSSCQPRNKTFSRVVLPISPHEWMLRLSGYRYSLPSCLSYLCYVTQTNTRIILTSMCILRRKIENTVTSAAKDCLLWYSVFSSFKLSLGIRHSIQSIAAVTTTTCWLQFQRRVRQTGNVWSMIMPSWALIQIILEFPRTIP